MTISDKRTKDMVYNTTVCYWRKTWGLANFLVDFFRSSPYLISFDGDYSFVAKPNIIKGIVRAINGKLFNINDEIWEKSLWSPAITRSITMRNLSNLLAADEWIREPYDKDLLDYYIREDHQFEPLMEERDFVLFLKERENYVVTIELVNSY